MSRVGGDADRGAREEGGPANRGGWGELTAAGSAASGHFISSQLQSIDGELVCVTTGRV